MDKPFDVIGKTLIAASPADWLALIGVTDTGATPVELVDGDLATFVQQADRVLLRGGDLPELYNLEVETGHHGNVLAERLLLYSVAITNKYKLPVRSAVFLLKKEADSPALTGTYERRDTSGTVYLRFSYQVVRVWQLPVETLLTGGLATLPLAPIADVPEADLPSVIARMRERVENEPDAVQGEFWNATFFLMGTKYEEGLTSQLLKGMGTMFESTTYNATIEKGVAKGLSQGLSQGLAEGERRGRLREGRELILALGRDRLGEPSPETVARLEAVTEPEQFPSILRRVAAASSWSELFPA